MPFCLSSGDVEKPIKMDKNALCVLFVVVLATLGWGEGQGWRRYSS